MSLEEEIERLQSIIQELCPHKEIEIIYKSHKDDRLGNLYECKLCRYEHWAHTVQEFRKKGRSK